MKQYVLASEITLGKLEAHNNGLDRLMPSEAVVGPLG
jgi:hypothetical protein